MAGVALSHGINANVVHRWLREPIPSALVLQSQANAFMPVTLDDLAPGPASRAEPDTRVKVQRADVTIVFKWPLQDVAACAAWLCVWLQ